MLNNIAATLSGGAVAPSPVSGMAVWYDANDAGTFTYSSSNIISQWGDKSGNSRNATQATVASQPTRVTGVINGLPVVRFDGSNDSMSFTNILNGDTSFTLFWVLRPRNVSSGTYQPSFSSQTTSPDMDDGALHFINPTGYGASYPFVTKSWSSYDNTNTYVANTSYLMEFIADGSVFKVFRNGTQESTNKNVGSAPAYTNTNIAKQNNPAGRFGAFDFGEILIYTTALSGADVTTNRNYLNSKWGL
jgi:hypothetical protein